MLSPVLFPQQNVCHLCACHLEKGGLLCRHCMDILHDERFMPDDAVSYSHRPLMWCLSVYEHRGMARHLVRLLKYASDTALAPLLAQDAARVLSRRRVLLEGVDLVLPVPLHPSRLKERGFNQAELLARELCASLRLPMNTDALVRVRDTGTQVQRGREQRLASMRGAFAVARPSAVRGKRILLVDDVLTTGATLIACTEALLWAQAAEASAITMTRALDARRGI